MADPLEGAKLAAVGDSTTACWMPFRLGAVTPASPEPAKAMLIGRDVLSVNIIGPPQGLSLR
jgi:hypothetical protein